MTVQCTNIKSIYQPWATVAPQLRHAGNGVAGRPRTARGIARAGETSIA
jgi:hypothetical protein